MAETPEATVFLSAHGHKVYRICSAGMCVEHRQWWQALVSFHAMAISKGILCGDPEKPELEQ